MDNLNHPAGTGQRNNDGAKGKRSEEFFKSKKSAFQKTLNSAYLKVAKDFKIPTLDASGSREEVLEKLKTLFKI